ncbi:3-deoxy-manno-octulosonate cytidylyltransferase [Nafulsella turpanensis]|uniref:3-deoxy-manno-octulosonate cytidylyltransferase n=1 Tax=Nafulsella turpanensis TaxID=1265690 RepID=UPI00034698AE|nr:3-deoxy-manno-octulosonate cytidylyltransferase [Nafulsella turpanensis]
MKIIGIIPARYGSSRFPAKALANIKGKPMVQWVWEKAKACTVLDEVIVATDHPAIYEAVEKAGGKACMTNESHQSGTDRCHEALMQQKEAYDYVINIQGDEPFIDPGQIKALAALLNGQTELATLMKRIKDPAYLFSPNTVKVVANEVGQALYFSRSPIPHIRNQKEEEWLQAHSFYKHIGIYAYRADVLEKITRLPPSSLEQAESLEQLRWLQAGFRIQLAETSLESMGIDTPEDLQRALAFLDSKDL